MLILCSNGLSSNELLQQFKLRIGNCKYAALVVTADPVYKEKNYHVPRCVQELGSLGLTVDIFDLDVQPSEQLLQYDVVEFIGGNPYYLLNSIRSTNAIDPLRYLAEKKVLIGWSAAASVFGPTLGLLDRYTPEMNELGLTDLHGIALTDCIVLPHYSKFIYKFRAFEETCRTFEAENHVSVIRLNDGEGVFITDTTIDICKVTSTQAQQSPL